ncbi:TraB/GumN family protein [Salirhabdus sp. Marseille-P4669]|uniref:TraB/GumN family protein n=1 Tax=Salirhabdus sp. Marseille-P4669 TaxID=2042310 RepID=UPI0013581807|nr:TraB/GumN family protein [Salirhabdus sp. Marseille-P4669]
MLKKWLLFVLTAMLLLVMVACNSDDKNEAKDSDQKETETVEPNEDEEVVEEGAEENANQEEATGEGSGGFLWKSTHNNNTVYMLGSIHVATPDFYPLHEKIEKAFDESDYLAVEADIVNVNVFEMNQLVNERAQYTDGTTLEDHIPADLYAQVKKYLEETGIPLATVNGYEPWYVYNVLESLQVMLLGYDSTLGIDYHFLEAATEEQKDIIELESVEFQLDMLDSFSPEIQESLLQSTVENQDQYEEQMKKMTELWKSGDEEGLSQYLFSEEAETVEDEEFMKVMLDDRNVGMTDKIEGFLTEGEGEVYFVIVGAAHYFGEQGIIKLLEERGYTVEKQL